MGCSRSSSPHTARSKTAWIERVIRALKEHASPRQRFDSIRHATRAISDWISFCNNRRPHQALAMRSPAEAFRLAA
ncbi:integrase core domain-containing protein [Pseudogemmobacter faecipullorum]|uniref:integrase core domain-containing protein n=1 Tax=Pseudogemmobacter faecipullorum TaxID=2755041 RepID=UPI00338F73A1